MKISKYDVDEILALARNFYNYHGGDEEVEEGMSDRLVCAKIRVFKHSDDVRVLTIRKSMDDLTNQTAYKLLEVLGYEIIND